MDEQKQIAFMKAYEPCHESFMRYCSALSFGKMDLEVSQRDGGGDSHEKLNTEILRN